jgi:hypothetical protein
MIKRRTSIFVSLFFVVSTIAAQTGKTIRFTSAHAMFPDTARAKGHNYNGKQYDAATNYSDSSVLIYVPQTFKQGNKIKLVFWGNDAYLEWLSVPEHRFINIYTKDGGTFDNSHFIMKQLTDSLHVSVISLNEDDVNEKLIRDNNKLFMFSSQGHNEVITHNRNWERFLRNIPAKK